MVYEKDSKNLDLKVSAGFNDLYKEGAQLATARVDIKLNQKKPDNLQLLVDMNRSKRNAGGQVTNRTLEYIEKLICAINMKYYVAHVDGEPSSLLFTEVAWIGYEGDLDEKTGFRWRDVIEVWNLPKGMYFTVDSFPKYIN